jgi:bifunctional non-homologous end joining protein LigD
LKPQQKDLTPVLRRPVEPAPRKRTFDRKRRLARLLGRAKRRSIQFTEHLMGDGPTVFEHVCRMGLEGIVSKRTDAPYRSGPSKVWLKSKNPLSEAVRREREEEWR